MNIKSKKNLYLRYIINSISPKLQLKLLFRFYHHRNLNLQNPQTLDEKIQWMKLYYYKGNELVKRCADKYQVREYIKECGIKHILNDIIATYEDPSEVEWDALPKQFVLKWNFGCGGNYVCFDKDTMDKEKVVRDLTAFKTIKFHKIAAEPQYDVKKILLCEKMIASEDGHLPVDYKFYCFNGEAKYVLCCYGRGKGSKPSFYFFDRNWELQRFNKQGKAAPEGFTIPKPEGIDDLFKYAEILSKPFPFVRADFYLEEGKAYFGELTFTPASGFDKGRLFESDMFFGSLVKLPVISK